MKDTITGNPADVCKYLQNIIIKHTPDNFVAREQFRYGLTDAEINAGISAFRTFLYDLYDKIAAINSDITASEFAAVLYFMGIYGKLDAKSKLAIRGSDLLVKNKKGSKPYQVIKKMKDKRMAEIFAFLADMGFCFEGIDYSKPVSLSDTGTFYTTNKNDANIITGLKLLAKAQEHTATDYDRLQNGFMRCNFYPLASETPINYHMQMIDFADTQPPEIKDWLMDLDKLLIENGCHIDASIWEYASISYMAGKQMVCSVEMMLSGCKIIPNTRKAKSLDKIAPALSKKFIEALEEDGCECGRNCKNGAYKIAIDGKEYVSCHNPPHKPGGFIISLDDAKDRNVVRRWIELEMGV